MLVIAVCVALVALGVALVVEEGEGHGRTSRTWNGPATSPCRSAPDSPPGVLAAGAGGRLMMRLLGATSPDVHGLTTEAGETIGEITVGGTLAFLVVRGPARGLPVRRALRAGRAACSRAAAPAAWRSASLLLVLFATRIEPLRADSIDFLLLEPAWLAVLGFSALALFQGMLVAALAPAAQAVARRAS